MGKGARSGLAGKARFLFEAVRFGYIDPFPALASGLRRAPIHRKITWVWADRLMRRLDVRLQPLPGAPMLEGRRCLYFFPHRSAADFFVHKVITGGRAATLSRMIVAGLFPPIWFATRFDRSTWFFVRGRRRTRREFHAWLDAEFERCPLPGLIVYPEGHRHQGTKPLRLQSGLIHYAWERKLPVQVVMTANTERVIDEKRLLIGRGVTVPYRFYDPLEPADAGGAGDFRRAISEVFTRAFAEVVAGNP